MSTHVYQNPKSYSANNNLQYAFARQLPSKIKIFPTDRILDVGCDDGRITADEPAVSANKGTVVGTENAGLNITSLVEEEMIYWYENMEQLQAFFGSSMTHVKRIPEDYKNEFLDDVSNEFINMLGLKKGNPIPVSFWCLQVIATKPALELSHVVDDSGHDKIKNSFSAKL